MSAIDATKPVSGNGATTASVRANFSAAASEIDANTAAAAAALAAANAHAARVDNPHTTTAAQVGAPSGSGTSTGANSGDNAINTLYSAVVSNATHTGDATGATALTLATVNANVGTFGSGTLIPVVTTNAKGLVIAISTVAVTAGGSGDMVLASAQTNTGAKTYNAATLLLNNVAGTFASLFTNTNTAARTYTLKDASGTVAFISDITGTNSNTNTGDQTITLTGGVTGSGTGSFAATVATNANMTGPITSTGNATAVAAQTGTGTTFVMQASPTLTTPVLGVASATSLAITGTAGAGFQGFVAQSLATTAPAAATANLFSSTTNGFTRLTQQNEAATSLVLGRDNVMLVRNTSGVTISKGSAVYATGSTGSVPNVSSAQANSSTTVPALGILVDDVVNNAYGQSMLIGVISSLNTSAFTAGASLFVSATVLGGLTTTRPTGTTNFVQRVGTVLVSGVGTGSIKVAISPSLLNAETGTNAAIWTGNSVVASSLTLSGNVSSPAWTTSGLRLKGVAATLTDTTSTGTVAAAYTDALGGNTIAAASATTYTNYITAYFRDPIAGTNVTMTNKWSLGADSFRAGSSGQFSVSAAGVMTLPTLSSALNSAATVTVASATTTDIGAAASNELIISGLATITGLGTIAAGARRWVHFSGALILTHNATSLILPTGASITTVAGDTAEFVSLGAGNWRCSSYDRASGSALVGGGGSGLPTDGSGTMTGAIATTVGTLTSSVANGASAKGFSHNTSTAYTTTAKLDSWANNGVEKAYIQQDGYFESTKNGTLAYGINVGAVKIGIGRNSGIAGLNLHGTSDSSDGAASANLTDTALTLQSGVIVKWAASANVNVAADIGIVRNATGVAEFNNGTAGAFRDLKLRNLIVSAGVIATDAAAPTLASAAVIAPTTHIAFVSGVVAINTITAPSPISAGGGQITLIPTGLFSTTTAGNIALASTAVVSRALILSYDVTTGKWYPSY